MRPQPFVARALWVGLLACALSAPAAFAQTAVKVGAVNLAQTHVLNADGDPEPLGLIGDRAILFKANFVANQPGVAPSRVRATLQVSNGGGQSTTVALQAPRNLPFLPTSFDNHPGRIEHSFDNSHTGTIPAAWVKPGLRWELSWEVLDGGGNVVSAHSLDSPPLAVRPPTKLIMSVIDVQWFEPEAPLWDFPTGFFAEMEQKMPVSDLELRRTRPSVFTRVAMPYNGTHLPQIVESVAHWNATFGDGDVTRSSRWASVLQKAAGANYYEVSNFCVINHGSVASGGVGADGYFCSSQAHPGVFWHEFGHSFMLRHWGEPHVSYPYKDQDPSDSDPYSTYFGVSTGSLYNKTHVGPYWGFDARNGGTFLSPRIVQNGVPRWRGEPMQGGGQIDRPSGMTLAHFSDYSIHKINGIFGRKLRWLDADNEWLDDAYWAEHGAGWYFLSDTNGKGYLAWEGDGLGRPVNRDFSVYSVLVAGSMASNGGAQPFGLIYPPIGPYKSNVRTFFDPRNPADRQAMNATNYCPAGGCDLSLRIRQEGAGFGDQVYALAIDWDATKPYTDASSFFEIALNVPASQGRILDIELLHTPDVGILGFPGTPEVRAGHKPGYAPPPPVGYGVLNGDQITLDYFGAGVPEGFLDEHPEFLKEFQCPPDSVLAAIDAYHDDVGIRGIGFSCALVNPNGTLGATVTLTGETSFGDTAATRASLTCPPNFITGVRGRAVARLNKIGHICATIDGVMSGVPEWENPAVGGDWGDFVESSCPAEYVASGAKVVTYASDGVDDWLVDDLQLICTKIGPASDVSPQESMFDAADEVYLDYASSGADQETSFFDCPVGMAVSGLDVLADNTNVLGVRFHCAHLSQTGEIGTSVPQAALGLGYPDSYGSLSGGEASLPCPVGFLTGIRGNQLNRFLQLGHFCSDLSEVFEGTHSTGFGDPFGPFNDGYDFGRRCPIGYAMTGAQVELQVVGSARTLEDMKAKCTRVLEVQGTADDDQDGDVNALDNCSATSNPGQHDQDADFEGDSCDSDPDGDGRVLAEDNCPFTSNDTQADSDGNGAGDACVPGLEPPFAPLETGSNHEYLYFVPFQDNTNNALRRGDTIGFHDGRYVGAFEQGNSLFSAYDKESDSYPIYTFRTFANLGAVSDVQLSLSDKGLSVESYDPDTGEKVSQQLAAFPELEFGVDVLVLVLDNDGLFKAIAVDLLPDGSMSAQVIWQTTPSGRHIRPATPLDRQDPLYRYVLHEADPVVTPPQQFFSEADGTELVGGDLPVSEWEEISDLIQFFVLDGKSDKLVTVVDSLCPGLLDGAPVDLPSCPLAQEYTQLVSVGSAVADYVRKGLIGGQLAIPNLACLSRDGSMQSCAVPPDYSPAYDDAGLPGSLLASPAGEHSPVVASLLGSRPDVGVVGQVTCENGLCPPAIPGWGPALQHGAFYFITYDAMLDDFSYWAVPLDDRACLRDSAASDDDKCPIVTHFGGSDELFDIAAIAPALEPTGGSELVLLNKCRKVLDIEAVLESPLSDDDLALQDSTFLKWECSLQPDGLAALATAQADRVYLFLNRVVLEIMQLETMALVMGTVPSALTMIGWEAATVEQGAALFFGAQGLTSVASHAVDMLEVCPSIDQLLAGQVDPLVLGECGIASMHVLFDAEMIAGAYRASLSLEEKLSPTRKVFAREFDLKSSVAGGVAEDSMSELVREVGEVKDIDATRRSGICVQ